MSADPNRGSHHRRPLRSQFFVQTKRFTSVNLPSYENIASAIAFSTSATANGLFNLIRADMVPRERISSIQYVRGTAAVAVIIWHTGWSRTSLGQSGVDLFFVVSGFIMMLVSGQDKSPIRFGIARITRIVPLYWIMTLLMAAINQSPASKLLTSLIFWPDGPFPIIIQGWSLNLEMVYYVLFAFTLTVPVRWRLSLLSLEVVILCILFPFMTDNNDVILTWSNPMAFEFLSGAALYLVWRNQCLPTGLTAWIIGVAAFAALGATHLLQAAPGGWMRTIFWGLPSLAIVAAGLGIERAGQLPWIGLLAWLGEASYSIYLTHLLAIRVLSEKLMTLWAPIAVIIVVVIASLFGLIVHLVFEKPIQRWINTLLFRT